MMSDAGGYPSKGTEEAISEDVTGGIFSSIIDIFIDPVKVFRRVEAGLTWWKPYIVIAVVSVIHGWLNLPIQRRIIEIRMNGMSEEQAQEAAAQFGRFGFIGLLTAPILLLIVLVISAGIAHIIINVVSSNSNYKKTLSLITFCGFIGMLEQIISVVVVRLRGVEAIESFADQRASFSLAALLPDVEGFWSAFMESLSIFQIWYYILLTLGVAMVFKIERKKAVIPAVIMWIISLAFIYLGTKFGGGMS